MSFILTTIIFSVIVASSYASEPQQIASFKSLEHFTQKTLNSISKDDINQKEKLQLLQSARKTIEMSQKKISKEKQHRDSGLNLSMYYYLDFLEIILGHEKYDARSCYDYRARVIHGFSPRNDYPKTSEVPKEAYWVLQALSKICRDDDLAKFPSRIIR